MNEMNQNLPASLRSAIDEFYNAPQPDPTFAEELEANLRHRQIEFNHEVGKAQERKRVRSFPRWTMKPWVLAGLVAALTLAVMLSFPSARTAVAQWLGLSFERSVSPNPLVQQVVAHRPLSEMDSYEYSVYELPKDRWALIDGRGFRLPQPGEQITLPNGDQISIPSYLPDSFIWQDIATINQSTFTRQNGFPMVLRGTGGGGGGGPMPTFDRALGVFLIGGDPANHYLVLSQFRDLRAGLSIRTFFTTSPDRQPEQVTSEGNPERNIIPTPTPVLQSFQAKLQIGFVVEPSHSENGITLMVGPGELHEVKVGENSAWWYQGAWDLQGNWNSSASLTNLVWKQGDHVYQLTGEDINIETLMRIADMNR